MLRTYSSLSSDEALQEVPLTAGKLPELPRLPFGQAQIVDETRRIFVATPDPRPVAHDDPTTVVLLLAEVDARWRAGVGEQIVGMHRFFQLLEWDAHEDWR